MNRNLKLVLMFAPLALLFVGLIIIVNDMRHPLVSQETCIITGVGLDAQPYKAQGPYLYKNSTNPLYDVSMRCDRRGVVLVNETQLLQTPIKSGEAAHMTVKHYQYLPQRLLVDVDTGKPPSQEAQRP